MLAKIFINMQIWKCFLQFPAASFDKQTGNAVFAAADDEAPFNDFQMLHAASVKCCMAKP